MKRYSKYLLVLLLLVMALSTAAVAYAAPGDEGPDGPGGPRHGRGHGLGGEVTAVSDSGLTIVTPEDETVEVNVSDETEIHLIATQEQGALDDIAVGNNVMVKGRPNEQGAVDAKVITVEPEGDKVGGKVTAVENNSITVENRDSTATILIDDETEIRIGEETGSIDDITEGMGVAAYGETQDDGSLAADLVLVKDKDDRGPGGPGGRGDGPPPPPGDDTQAF